MPSIRSCSRARTNSQRGFALIAAIVLAMLFFALIELLLIDSARDLGEARRFRARIVATTLAENGAELAALSMVTRDSNADSIDDAQGTIQGTMTKRRGNPLDGDPFEIEASAETKGLIKTRATVRVYGVVFGNQVKIRYAMHTP